MKKLLLSLMAIVLFTNLSFGQKTTTNGAINYPGPYQIFKDALEGKVSQIKNLNNVSGKTNNNINLNTLFEENQQEAELFMSPLLAPAIGVLNYEGINNSDIINEYGSLNNPNIVICATNMFAIKTKELKLQVGLEEQGKYSTSDLILDCIKEASGIAELTVIATVGFNTWLSQMGKKAAMRALVKLGAKYFGWIGAAVFAYDVIECIYSGD
jgi:hypothetical protein